MTPLFSLVFVRKFLLIPSTGGYDGLEPTKNRIPSRVPVAETPGKPQKNLSYRTYLIDDPL